MPKAGAGARHAPRCRRNESAQIVFTCRRRPGSSGRYAITPQWIVDGGIFHVSNEDQDRKANLYSIRGTYKFDDQLSTYLTLGYIDNSSKAAYGVSGGGAGAAPSAGNSQLGAMAGVRYRF